MVSQAARQTRFRTLKHENGIAGKSTIVVRVIACFQPLQNCQECSARDDFNLICMSIPLEPQQQEHLAVCLQTVLQGFPMPKSRFKIEPKNDVHGLQCLPSQCQTFLPFQNSDLKQARDPLGLSGRSVLKPNAGSLPKRFLIFDQSGNQTRVMYHVVDTSVHIQSTFLEKHSDYHCQGEAHTLTENNLLDEETEMHDSEAIDALFYSDNDYDCISDDEVTSTGHSPVVEENYKEQKQRLEITEGIASSDGPRKRQRLLDGGFTKSSQLDTASCSVKVDGSHEYFVNTESRYDIGHVEWNEINSGLAKVPSKKEKILETLKVLESIIPGAKDKDPFLVIDEAITHLKSLKDEAKTLGDRGSNQKRSYFQNYFLQLID